MAFKNHAIGTRSRRNIWKKCLVLTTKMTFIMSYIYREGNPCAEMLTNLGISFSSYIWWKTIPLTISKCIS